jgi:hypothetical protein
MVAEILEKVYGYLTEQFGSPPGVAEAMNFAFFYDSWVHRSLFPPNCPALHRWRYAALRFSG